MPGSLSGHARGPCPAPAVPVVFPSRLVLSSTDSQTRAAAREASATVTAAHLPDMDLSKFRGGSCLSAAKSGDGLTLS